MHVGLQAKLLRVLEERRLRRLGGSAVIELNVRVLAASNRNLVQAVHTGQLRADLYYRLNVFPLHLPPLRERTEDLPLLIEAFIKHYAALNQKKVLGISQECASALATHPWPGNVRQLRNVIERAVIMSASSLIERGDLPDEFQAVAPVQDEYFTIRIGTPLSAIEQQVILQTLELMKGNQRRTAQALGVSIRTLHNKLKQYRRAADSPVSEK
jgi:transcriptional regulator with PAS, ATPase and Fis domain